MNARNDPGVRTPLIELSDIHRKFITDGGVEVHALRGVSLQIYPGEFVAITGQSGSGKSTLLSVLGCLDRPSSGTYRFYGQDIRAFDADGLASLRREAFGFVFQNYNLLNSTTAQENVELPAIYCGMPPAKRKDRAAKLLQALGMGARLNHRPNQLSGGQQQRVSIARALMNGGQIILADEPTGALDSENGREVMALLDQLANRGHTVVVVTHEQHIANHADRLIEMHDGRVVKDTLHRGSRYCSNSELVSFHKQLRRRTAILGAGIGEAVRMAFTSLHVNRFRTSLTLLGIIIGVASVISMLAIGEAAQRNVLERIAAMGANQLQVFPDRSRGGAPGLLNFDDATALRDAVPNVLSVLPEITGEETLRYLNQDYSAPVTAISANLPETRSWRVASGMFFTDHDSETYAPVAVIGATVRKQIFRNGIDPVGKYILIRNIPFLVVGVMSAKGAAGFGSRDQDDVVFVPLKTGALRLFGRPYLRSITVVVDHSSNISQTEAALNSFLHKRHGNREYRIFNSAELLENVSRSRQTFTVLLGSVAAISLLVGGIGVMNIMLVSVAERTREIGVRVATGARQNDILVQFLTEAIVVCAIGGGLGVLLGFGVGTLMDSLGAPAVFTPGPVLLALGCATATGLIFGYTPARKAARLDPVVALAKA